MKDIVIVICLIFIIIFIIYFSCLFLTPQDHEVAEVEEKVKPNDSFSLYVVADVHYMSKELQSDSNRFREYVNNGDKLIQYSDIFMDALIDDISKNNPDVIVFAGDLTCNGSRTSHEDFAKKLLNIKSLDTEVYVVPGNHDLNNERAIRFIGEEIEFVDYVTEDEFVEIYKEFGYNSAEKDTDSLSYLVKPRPDLWLIMIDSTREFPHPGGYLSDSTLSWIEECSRMAELEDARMVVVMHHNLLDHSKLINENYTVLNNTRVLNVFHKCNIDIVLTGHTHVQDIKSNYSSEICTTIYDICTSALSSFPHQYGHLTYSPREGYSYETIRLDIEKYAAKNKIKDENLLSFTQYSENFFVNGCCKSHHKNISNLPGFTDIVKEQIINTVTEMNKAFFSGYRNEALKNHTETEGFKFIEKLEECFIKNYIMEMLDDERADNNYLIVELD